MTRKSWNAAANYIVSYNISPDFSVNAGLGLGFTAITLDEAKSLQSTPATAGQAFEMTTENGGGPANTK